MDAIGIVRRPGEVERGWRGTVTMASVPLMIWRQIEAGDVVLVLLLFLLATAAASWVSGLGGLQLFGRHTSRIQRFAVNIGALLALEQAYELARGQVPYSRDVAFLHSYAVMDFEWRHGFFIESRLEQFFLQFRPLIDAIDVFYAVGHAVGTIGVLVWLYIFRRSFYGTFRNLFMVTTALALLVFYLYPTAPPRMFANYGFTDPEQMQQLVAAGGAQLNSYMYNPYAAMPSLHVAYAVIVGLALIVAGGGRVWRVLGACYPVAMAATVLITANHWILDVVGACFTVALAWGLLHGMRRLRNLSQWASPARAARPRTVMAVPVQE